MRLAVTGASGFCGGVVARLAAGAGHEVVCLGRRPGPVGAHLAWDAGAGPPPGLAGIDAVVHLAATVGDPRPGRRVEAAFHAVNVAGTAHLLDAAQERKVVWVSSASVYRPGPYAAPVAEEHPTSGQRNAYGRSKAAGERLALAAGAVVLRPRAVYGDGDRHLLPRLGRVVRAGRAWLPGPDVAMSLTAVENLAAACLAALEWPGGAYNIADARPYRRDEVFAQVLGVPVRHLPAGAARALAAVSPTVTRYAVDQLTDGMVLELGKAHAHGYRPERTLRDYLLRRDGS